MFLDKEEDIIGYLTCEFSACQNIRTPYNVKCEQILSNQ